MLVARISFKNAKADQEGLIDAAYSVLLAWYKNGQIASDHWVIGEIEDGLSASVYIPARDALKPRFANRYVRQALREYKTRTAHRPSVEILGRYPEGVSPCKCKARPSYILFTTYLSVGSPLRCSNCFRPVPLYAVPPIHDEEYLDMISWMADYQACDTLQMHCTVGERFGEQQLVRHDSSLSMTGRKLCQELEKKTDSKVYYYLLKHRGKSPMAEKRRRCPNCNDAWLLKEAWHGLFDFRCERCRLLSNIAFSVRP